LRPGLKILLFISICFLILNSAYVGAYAEPTLFYVTNVFAHLAAGSVIGMALLWAAWRERHSHLAFSIGAALCVLLALVSGGLIVYFGGTRPYALLVLLHGALGAAALLTVVLAWRAWFGSAALDRANWKPLAVVLAGGAFFFAAAVAWQKSHPEPDNRFVQQLEPPLDMAGEGIGENTAFFPSASETNTRGLIPSNFFMKTESCGQSGCHSDIYKQWHSSAHHFSSFNNQWYRKSIEYMQDVTGTRPSKWCAGCHDHAVFFNGRFDRPIKEQIDTPEAQAGLTCTSCHSISKVKNSMGNGGFVIRYPPLHDLATSDNPILKRLHDFFVKIDPEPHRRTFIKDFHRKDTAEFCSACHKVHLDKPVNDYRWFRGFNDYDAWQASGVSGQGARSFYYPPKAMKCADCHMPLVNSDDAGNIGGRVHDHRFIAANTALPFANKDEIQLKKTIEFLQNNQVTVDIFGINRVAEGSGLEEIPSGQPAAPRAATHFAEVEEMGAASGVGAALTDVTQLTAPLDPIAAVVRAGESVRVEVVVRTRGVGHFFPGGTVDAFDVWLALKAEDEKGIPFYWSGMVEDNGRGPVEKGAHFYRSFLLDEKGNPINKRNAWAARSVLYVRLIPPGAADTAHFRLKVPENAGSQIKLTATLNYRKFSWWNTHWAYAGVRDPSQGPFALGKGYDSSRWIFAGDTSLVSGALKEIPNLPAVAMASDTVTLRVAGKRSPIPATQQIEAKQVRERWNDYGIGLLLQGDLRGAEAVFQKVAQMDPAYADGFVNVARCRIQIGDNAGAQEALEKALKIDPKLAKAHYFYGQTLKIFGRYDDALKHLRIAQAQYPRDRAVLNEIGRVLLLQRRYDDSIAALRRVLEVDPEDLQAHYNLMLACRGTGRIADAQREQALYERFKADEASQAITGDYRRQNPEDNNERQRIHEHGPAILSSYSRPRPVPSTANGAPQRVRASGGSP